MGHQNASISALLKRAKQDLASIEEEYNNSLSAQSVSDDLRIDIKNLLENLRSVLDYLAHDIRDKYCAMGSATDRFYFPILPDRKSFDSQMSRWFPGLEKSAPDLWKYLESIQPYNGADREWIARFSKVNNENKHRALIEQTKSSTEEIRVDIPGGGRVSWNPSSVKFGEGVYIGGVPVNPQTQMPIPFPTQKVTRTLWVDFRFAGADVSALALLKDSLEGISKIVNTTRKWL
jgi:hypothetical protein